MKRITHLAVMAALAFSAQAAWSEEQATQAPAAATESAETYLNVAQVAGSGQPQEVARRAPAGMGRNMLEELGLSSGDGFPSRGGPIDD